MRQPVSTQPPDSSRSSQNTMYSPKQVSKTFCWNRKTEIATKKYKNNIQLEPTEEHVFLDLDFRGPFKAIESINTVQLTFLFHSLKLSVIILTKCIRVFMTQIQVEFNWRKRINMQSHFCFYVDEKRRTKIDLIKIKINWMTKIHRAEPLRVKLIYSEIHFILNIEIMGKKMRMYNVICSYMYCTQTC